MIDICRSPVFLHTRAQLDCVSDLMILINLANEPQVCWGTLGNPDFQIS